MAAAYRGRFAPSPSGPLHFGSLVAALGSCLDARAHGGAWLLRIEDVDTPRNVPGAEAAILRTLEACGFEWDGPVLRQSGRLEAYAEALERLKADGFAYPCACSRKEIADSATRPAIDGGLAYPGTCRAGLPPGRSPRAWRLRVDDREIAFDDRLQGRIAQHLAHDVGDFVLRRADGLFAYQLAVVVDDAWQGVTDVVRGADLLDSTPRQLYLQELLGFSQPRYLHVPLITQPDGHKLGKSYRSPPLPADQATPLLIRALRALGQQLPDAADYGEPTELLRWASMHWDATRIPRSLTLAEAQLR